MNSDPQSFPFLLEKFLEWLAVHNFAAATIRARREYLKGFIAWAEQRGLAGPRDITQPILERYQHYLFHYRKADGAPLTFRSQLNRLLPIRAWFKWLARYHHILYNPAGEIELPKLEHKLPKHVLTAGEAEQVLALPRIDEPLGLRDRAILETLYSTGIRRQELVDLKVYGIDAERGTVTIRRGKNKKDRVVPIGARALAWIQRYLYEVRPGLLIGEVGGAGDVLFLTSRGEPFTAHHLTYIVTGYVEAAQLGKSGSCHLFRHTMATLMLENGADIRYIQEMLGHAKIETTTIYTQVAIGKLKEVYERTHPA
ncbi:MAG: site-specific tyrosine recombinase XerC, partial [Pseudomonadota bacterium]